MELLNSLVMAVALDGARDGAGANEVVKCNGLVLVSAHLHSFAK